jgi:formylglycine-generating enzyme required for sulfatase activity
MLLSLLKRSLLKRSLLKRSLLKRSLLKRSSLKGPLSIAAVLVSIVTSVPAYGQACAGDLDNNAVVDGYDLATLLSNFGACAIAEPTISQVVGGTGPRTGGTVFAIIGTNLHGATSVTVASATATILSVTPTVVTALSPVSPKLGAKSVSVTTPGGTATLRQAFIYTSATPAWATLLEDAPDPAIVTNASLRAAIAAVGYPWRVRDNGTNTEMLLIPPGTFNMGCSPSLLAPCDPVEFPVHSVTLTQAFYLGRYEVTQAQWQATMGWNPSYFAIASAEVPLEQVPNRPVDQVTWNAVQGYLAATGMRLPTEAEWEFAYRAGTTTAYHGFAGYPAGTNDGALAGDIAWITPNTNDQTHPVGGKAANGFGLHDMAGNLLEWVNDWFGATYYASSPSVNPTGPVSGTYRVARGGSWSFGSDAVRASFRGGSIPTYGSYNHGFRVARNPN